ncbi:Fc.00g081830.m01.CDS01 [Cosmosporella sp. VM-42]
MSPNIDTFQGEDLLKKLMKSDSSWLDEIKKYGLTPLIFINKDNLQRIVKGGERSADNTKSQDTASEIYAVLAFISGDDIWSTGALINGLADGLADGLAKTFPLRDVFLAQLEDGKVDESKHEVWFKSLNLLLNISTYYSTIKSPEISISISKLWVEEHTVLAACIDGSAKPQQATLTPSRDSMLLEAELKGMLRLWALVDEAGAEGEVQEKFAGDGGVLVVGGGGGGIDSGVELNERNETKDGDTGKEKSKGQSSIPDENRSEAGGSKLEDQQQGMMKNNQNETVEDTKHGKDGKDTEHGKDTKDSQGVENGEGSEDDAA